jgi:hypothetical protein
MVTVRQIERLWEGKTYDRLVSELLSARPEGAMRLGIDRAHRIAAAAFAMIRLDELTQSHMALYPKLVRAVLVAQEADGGWGDLVITALCLRALLCGSGNGAAIDRGMAYLAGLQKTEGIWPNVPIRRMPADAYVSALIMYQLGEHAKFRQAVRLGDAVQWFTLHAESLDEETQSLWNRVKTRCRLHAMDVVMSLC